MMRHSFIRVLMFLVPLVLVGCGLIGGGRPKDADGNRYSTVVIGSQEWFSENLRTTRYANGDSLYGGLGNNEWRSATLGAYTSYPHEMILGMDSPESVSVAYGHLYNWYAVGDARGLCPSGWRVSTSEDWDDLLDYLREHHGISNNWDDPAAAGSQLKSCFQQGLPAGEKCLREEHPRWNAHADQQGLDGFGFSAFPAGLRSASGTFVGVGEYAVFWTSTQKSAYDAYSLSMNHFEGYVMGSTDIKGRGASVRCVRDVE